MKQHLSLFFLFGFLALSSTSANAKELRIVVAVGNNYGLSGEEPLKHAASDAKRVASVFTSLGGVKTEHALTLIDANPKEVEAAMGKAQQIARGASVKDVTFFFYYSGHGDKGALHLGNQKLSDKTLHTLVNKIPAGMKVLIIDACRSEGASRPKGWGLKPAVDIMIKPLPGPQGIVELRSSSVGEVSQESDELGGGVFTHYFITGLQGAADVDGDRQVTLDEVYPYAYNHTHMRTAQSRARLQRPERNFVFKGTGPLVLSWTSKARSMLVFPKGGNIQYLVYRLPTATVVAELWGESKRQVKLALSTGRYLVQRRAPGQYGATDIAMTFGGQKELSAWQFQSIPLKLLALKGGALILHRHEVTAQYGFLIGSHGDIGQRFNLGYGYRLGRFTLCARGQFALTSDFAEAHAKDTLWWGGDLYAKWPYPFGPLMATFAAGGSMQFRRQTVDNQELYSDNTVETEMTTNFLAGGPMLEASLDIYLGADLALNVGYHVASLFFQDSERITFSIDNSIWAGVTLGL